MSPDEYACENCGEIVAVVDSDKASRYCDICEPAFITDDLDILRQTIIEQNVEIEWLKEQLLWMYQEHTCCAPTDVWKKLTGKT